MCLYCGKMWGKGEVSMEGIGFFKGFLEIEIYEKWKWDIFGFEMMFYVEIYWGF